MRRISIILSLMTLIAAAARAETSNLMTNGSCDNPEHPLKYWTYDNYKNDNYTDNAKYIKLLPEFGGKKNVIWMQVTGATAMGGGVWLDSPFIPFEEGCRYRFTLSLQASGPCHIYVTGYGWKPGVRPYENPNWLDMRLAYKGGWFPMTTVKKGAWTKVSQEWPEKQLSAAAMGCVKRVKMMGLHFCGVTGEGDIYIKDLIVEKLPDTYTGGKITDDDRRKTKK